MSVLLHSETLMRAVQLFLANLAKQAEKTHQTETADNEQWHIAAPRPDNGFLNTVGANSSDRSPGLAQMCAASLTKNLVPFP